MKFRLDLTKFDTIKYANLMDHFMVHQIFRTIYGSKDLFQLPFPVKFPRNSYDSIEFQNKHYFYLSKFETESLFNNVKKAFKNNSFSLVLMKCSYVVWSFFRNTIKLLSLLKFRINFSKKK